MTIEILGEQKLITVRLDGEIDHHYAKKVREAVNHELEKTGAINVAFDFSGVTFMDSSGIGMIIGRYKTVKSIGGKVVLFGMSREIERIVKMSGIDKIADIY